MICIGLRVKMRPLSVGNIAMSTQHEYAVVQAHLQATHAHTQQLESQYAATHQLLVERTQALDRASADLLERTAELVHTRADLVDRTLRLEQALKQI